MKERWWLVPGLVVEYHGAVFKIKTVHDNKIILEYISGIIPSNGYNNIIPRGVPFDCIPDWAENVSFFGNTNDNKIIIQFEGQKKYNYVNFNNCPEEWKDKAFPITEELRRLLR